MSYFRGIDYHQDQIDFPNSEPDFVTMYVYLNDTISKSSPLHVIEKSHIYGPTKFPHFLKEVNEFGFSRIIHTDIERDGTKTRPNIEESLKLAKISKAPLVISGGIASIEDVKKIKTLEKFNIEGVIIGKAIYDGDVKLNELSEIENA